MKRLTWLGLSVVFILAMDGFGDDILRYHIESNNFPYVAANIKNTGYYLDTYSGYYTTSGDQVESDYWLTYFGNSFVFSFDVAPGYAIAIDRFEFNSQSQSYGPTEYNVTYATLTSSYTSISGGWQPLPEAGTGVRTNLFANNGGIPLTNLSGRVYIRIYGEGATEYGSYFEGAWLHAAMGLVGSVYYVAPAGALTLSASTYSVNEGAGMATVTVTRTGGSFGPAQVTYSTSNGTALAGTAYTNVTGTLLWTDGDTTPRTFTVPIIDDGLAQGSEVFYVNLSNLIGADTGTVSQASVTILDNDAATRIIGISGNLSFGNIVTGKTATSTMMVTNSGNSLLTVTNITYPSCFSGTWTGAVAAGKATNVTVSFAPASLQIYGGNLIVFSDATSGTNMISCSGTGVAAPAMSVTPSNQAFGPVPINTTNDFAFTVQNTGGGALTGHVGGVSTPFSIVGGTNYVLGTGATTTVTVRFVPTTPGTYSNNATFVSNGGTSVRPVTGSSGGAHLLAATAGPNGGVAPSSTNVPYGQNASFIITPYQYYHTDLIQTNGSLVGSNLGSTAYAYVWSNVTATGTLFVTFVADLAARGTPHWWLSQYGWTNNFDPVESSIGSNGMPVWQSYVADLDPTNPLSSFCVVSVSNLPPWTVYFGSSTARLYSLACSTNLVHGTGWFGVAGQSNVWGNGTTMGLIDTNKGGPMFYRVKVRIQE